MAKHEFDKRCPFLSFFPERSKRYTKAHTSEAFIPSNAISWYRLGAVAWLLLLLLLLRLHRPRSLKLVKTFSISTYFGLHSTLLRALSAHDHLRPPCHPELHPRRIIHTHTYVYIYVLVRYHTHNVTWRKLLPRPVKLRVRQSQIVSRVKIRLLREKSLLCILINNCAAKDNLKDN